MALPYLITFSGCSSGAAPTSAPRKLKGLGVLPSPFYVVSISEEPQTLLHSFLQNFLV